MAVTAIKIPLWFTLESYHKAEDTKEVPGVPVCIARAAKDFKTLLEESIPRAGKVNDRPED